MPPVRNMAASVRQRLLNLSKERDRRFNDVLQHYALERWLYRLSRSEHASRFILKGALMLTAWKIPVTRPTRDIDLLANIENDLDAIRDIVAAICRTPVEDDGIVFDDQSVVTARITKDADFEGVRATFQGHLGTARLPMQIDMGFGDIVTPAPVDIVYPTVLEMPAPKLRAYNRETAIAEKFEAMVKIGELNSRMKDFFDIWMLASSGPFHGPVLVEAIKKTFEQRSILVNTSEVCFTDAYARNVSKAAQWKAFLKRGEIKNAPAGFEDVWSYVMAFLRPIADAIETNCPFDMHWTAGGPWQPKA